MNLQDWITYCAYMQEGITSTPETRKIVEQDILEAEELELLRQAEMYHEMYNL
jgi:hypothetical protein